MARSVLHRRIAGQHRNMHEHAGAHYQPAVTAAGLPMGDYHPAPPQEMVMPLTIVQVTADGAQVSEAVPLYAGPRGAPVPATAPGRWVQVHAAGRP